VKRRTLDKEMVWHTFYYWVDGYCRAAQGYIDGERRKNPLVWNHLAPLHDAVVAFEKKKSRRFSVLSQETVVDLLDGETNL
jgi:hypothetical protein